MSWPNSERSGAPLNVPAIFFTSTSTHDGKPTFSASCSASWIRSWPLAFSVTRDDVAGLDQRRRNVHDLAVHRDRARGRPAGAPRRASSRSPSGRRRCRAATRGVAAGSRRSSPCGARPRRNTGGTAARGCRRCGGASASRAAGCRSPTAHAGFHAMLAGLGVELALGVERTTRAFQEKVGAFPSRQLAFGSGVSSHFAVLS